MKCQLKIESDNIMNIRSLYDRIVGKRIEEQETTGRGIVIPDSAKEKPHEGEVLAVGRARDCRMANWSRSMSNWATTYFLRSTPAARSSWMAPNT